MDAEHESRHLQWPNMVEPAELAASIRRFRQRRGLTQSRLAFDAGVSRDCVMRLEKSGEVSVRNLFAILGALQGALQIGAVDPENTHAARRAKLFASIGMPTGEHPLD